MFKLSYDEIVKKLVENNGISREEIERRVEKKMSELQGLISREGAAHIISNELGVKLFDFDKREFNIKEIVAGLRNININCKTIQKYDIREFNKENRKGKVATLLVGDETGTSRAVIWDENLIKDFEKINEGDVLRLENCYIKQNNNFKEIHLGSEAIIKINPENVKIKQIGFNMSFDKKKIIDIQPGEFASIFATIVQVFELRFYEACSDCNTKANLNGSNYMCRQHGIIKPKKVPVLSIYLDDGTENARAVSFGDVAYSVLGVDEKTFGEQENFDELKNKLLGKQMVFNGKVNRNTMFDSNEIILNSVEEIDPKHMAEEMLQ